MSPSLSPIAREYEHLLSSLTTRPFITCLDTLRVIDPALRCYATWDEVVQVIRHETSDTDPVLTALLRHRAMGTGTEIIAVLMAGLYPLLHGIARQRVAWDVAQPDEVWQTTLLMACTVLRRVDPGRRPAQIRQKILNDTAHHLNRVYRPQRHRRTQERSNLDEAIAAIQVSAEDWDEAMLEVIDQQEATERHLQYLNQLRERQVISTTDHLLLVGTRIYGRRVADQAVDLQMSFQTAKKRRQRAEAAIRQSGGTLPWA